MKNNDLIKDGETFLYYDDGLIDSPQIIQKLLDYKKSKNYVTNLSTPWPKQLIPKGVGEVKIWEVEDPTICSYLCYRIADIFPKVRTNTYKFNFQVTEWGEDCFIPWHCDSPHLCAVTCYLENKTEYGGDFLCKPFEDQTMGMLLEPKVNRAILVKGVSHCVSKIHKGSRTTLQVWGHNLNANV